MSLVNFTPLSGVKNEEPLCYILEIDNFRFMLDCGWDEECSMDIVERIKPYAPTIDAVLISHQGLEHIGALPYAYGKLGLDCPVYATLPVNQMGQLVMYDFYTSRINDEDFDLFDLKDVDEVFTSRIVHLKYSQLHALRGKGEGITIVPFNAGHSLGGTIWKIVKDQEEFVYAVDYNHKSEKHLSRCELERIKRPSLLITDAYNALVQKGPTRKDSENKLKKVIIETLRRNENLHAYHLVWLNQFTDTINTYAKSTLEWMSAEMMNAAINSRGNPFDIIHDGIHRDRHVQALASPDELDRLSPGPKVVLTTFPAMSVGFSRHIFVDWANDPNNLLLFTQRQRKGTLSHHILNDSPSKITLQLKKRVPLSGAELEEYLKKRKAEREAEKERQRQEEEAKRSAEDGSDESDDEGLAIDPRIARRHDLPMTTSSHTTAFFQHSPKYPMFPYIETKVKWDEYGLLINPEDYSFAQESRNQDDGMDLDMPFAEDADEGEDLDKMKKSVAEDITVEMKCRVEFVDFEGRTDMVSMATLLAEVNARQMVLVHGSEEATSKMAQYLTARSDDYGKVIVPDAGETATVTSDINVYLVKLTDNLTTRSEMATCQIGDKTYEVGWCNGVVHTGDAEGGVQHVPSLDIVAPDEVVPHRPLMIGEMNMMTLPRLLSTICEKTEFVGGVLVCDDVVAVSKAPDGKLLLQGPLCDKYFRIRDVVYGQHAIV